MTRDITPPTVGKDFLARENDVEWAEANRDYLEEKRAAEARMRAVRAMIEREFGKK